MNFGNSSVNRLRTQLGVEFRVTKHINYEVFWNRQFANEPEIKAVDAFGMTLKAYLDHKETKNFFSNIKKKRKLKKESKAKPTDQSTGLLTAISLNAR